MNISISAVPASSDQHLCSRAATLLRHSFKPAFCRSSPTFRSADDWATLFLFYHSSTLDLDGKLSIRTAKSALLILF